MLPSITNAWLDWIVAASIQLALLISIVGLASFILQQIPPTLLRFSAHLRYGIWLLCLVKVFLPPTWSAPWSIGRWGVQPALAHATQLLSTAASRAEMRNAPADVENSYAAVPRHSLASRARSYAPLLALLWLAGVVAFGLVIAFRYRSLRRQLRQAASVEEGPLRIALERATLEMGIKASPELLLTERLTSPFLIGFVHPTIVLPEVLAKELTPDQLQMVLRHELVHCKDRDTWIGLAQVVAQSLFWFHPFVWWSNMQLREARELRCDDEVLQHAGIPPQEYGATVVRVLMAARGRSLASGSLVGVFERGTKLQSRMEEIMSHTTIPASRTWFSWSIVAALALLLLPMGVGNLQPVIANAAEKTPFPQIVTTVPDIAARDVDPGLKEIRVTFDRDMQKGMSWTGDPALLPTLPREDKARWVDSRTCILPVRLEKAHYYCVGINSMNFQNFRSASGVPAPPIAIYFTTMGAPAELTQRLEAPKVVSLEPANGADDVDPSTSMLQVTFDKPMGAGMSWTGGGPTFPQIPGRMLGRWSEDGLTCSLPVELKPGTSYELGLNSRSHNNFQTRWGVPLEPVVYRFKTR